MRKLFATALIVLATMSAGAQSQQSDDQIPQGPTFRTGVDLIAVDVSVLNERGRPVEDLRVPDFTVKIDGQERRVVSAELVRVDVEAAKKQVEDKAETFFTTNLMPPNGRQIIIAVDQLSVRAGSIRTQLAAAAQFVSRLSPLDQVAFVAYPEPGPRVGFTTDRLRLRLAMESLVGHQDDMRRGMFNIGVTEALAIHDRRDVLVLNAVTGRECRLATRQAIDDCERQVLNEASEIAARVRQDAYQSIAGLRALLEQLTTVDGPKSMILISQGLSIDNDNDLDTVIRMAGRAQVSLNVLMIDPPRGDITVGEQPPSERDDRRREVEGLQSLASMTRGGFYHVVGTGASIFDRLLMEISAHYLLGVEQRPSDTQGDRHRIDVEVRRRNVTVRSRQAFVLSAATRPRRSQQENLREALSSPFAIAELPVRVTTYANQDGPNEKVRLIVAADVGQPGAAPAPYAVGYILIDRDNRVVGSFGEQRILSPASPGRTTEPLSFASAVVVDPGTYSLRLAVVDAEGRRGSVIRTVNAWKMYGEELALGDLIVGDVPASGEGLRAAVEPHVASEALAAYVELYSTTAEIFNSANVSLEIADDMDAPALATFPTELAPGRQPTWRVAQGLVPARMLPPGRYVARVKVTRQGKTVAMLARPFVFERAGTVGVATSPAAVAAASAAFAASLPQFDRAGVLRAEVVSGMLDIVEKRSPALKGAMGAARAGRYGPAALEALTAGDQTVAAFLRGLDLFAKGDLNQAATQLQIAAGARAEFFPAAFYLGASFAAAGRDRDAAGIWQLSLGSEPRPSEVYMLAADARMRDGQPASAIDILKPAYERAPANDDIARRLAAAYFLTAKYAEALPVLDAYLARHAQDHEFLWAAIVAQYELVRGGQTLSGLDRDKVKRYAATYRGPQEALIEKYLATMNVR